MRKQTKTFPETLKVSASESPTSFQRNIKVMWEHCYISSTRPHCQALLFLYATWFIIQPAVGEFNSQVDVGNLSTPKWKRPRSKLFRDFYGAFSFREVQLWLFYWELTLRLTCPTEATGRNVWSMLSSRCFSHSDPGLHYLAFKFLIYATLLHHNDLYLCKACQQKCFVFSHSEEDVCALPKNMTKVHWAS